MTSPPLALIVLPFIVVVIPLAELPSVKSPDTFKLLLRVTPAACPEPQVTLFHVIPLVFNVAIPAQLNVELVVVTVPEEYVNVPVVAP